MIKRGEQFKVEVKEGMRGGPGSVRIEHLWTQGDAEIKADNRLFAKLVMEPGSGIGRHSHDGEEEVYYVVGGTAEVDDDGVAQVLSAGDTMITGGGAAHSIRNIGPGILEVLAVISKHK